MATILLATLLAALTGLVLGLLIGFVAQRFAVEVDPRIEQVASMLPGANCGGCGFAGCADMARAIVSGEASPDRCPVCPAASVSAIAALLGKEGGGKEKKVAVVLCGGSNSKAMKSARYNGVTDCKSAALVAGGGKACKVGCLGYGSCSRACPFGAIEIRDGLAIVHPEICVGCGKCVDTCPKRLIKLVPAAAKVHVYCSNSSDKGPQKKKFCSVPCIACRKCVKAAGEGEMQVAGFLAQVDYSKPPAQEIVAKAGCPTGCLMTEESRLAAEPAKDKPAPESAKEAA